MLVAQSPEICVKGWPKAVLLGSGGHFRVWSCGTQAVPFWLPGQELSSLLYYTFPAGATANPTTVLTVSGSMMNLLRNFLSVKVNYL